MGIFANIKHLAPLVLYLASIFLVLKALFGDGRWALLLITFLIPLRNIIEKIQGYPLGTQMIDILIAAALFGWLASSILNKKQVFSYSALNASSVILVVYMIFSTMLGNYNLHHTFSFDLSEERVKDCKNFCLMPLLFFITLNYMTEKEWIYRTLIAMVLAMILMDYYTIHQINEYSSLQSRDKIGGTFQFLGPNEVAAFYNEFTIVLIGIFFFIKKPMIKWSLLAMICINIFCILCLYSRGAYLGLYAGMFFLCLFKNRKFLIPLILLGIFWQNVLPEKSVERIEQTTSNDGQLDTSAQRRINIWEYSLDLFKQNYLVGIGFGVFRTLGLDLGDTHNIYVKYLVEQGSVGFIILLFVILCFLRMGYVLYKKGEDDLSKGMGLGLMACVIVLMINNFFGDRWSYLEMSAYLWIFAGLVGRLIVMPKAPEPSPEIQETTRIKTKKKVRYYDL